MARPKGSGTITPPEQRFWAKVVKGVAPDDCWGWSGAKRKSDGYGAMKIDNKTRRSHVVSYEIHHGPVPAGMLVCHRCDNPQCCNPRHLFLGSHKQNTQDMLVKGRHRTALGVASPFAKLSDDAVREIRGSTESSRWLGRKFEVSKTVVLRVKNRRGWKHVD